MRRFTLYIYPSGEANFCFEIERQGNVFAEFTAPMIPGLEQVKDAIAKELADDPL